MGLMDELKKLTQPFDDEDEVYEGADEAFTAPRQKSSGSIPGDDEIQFEEAFGDDGYDAPEPAAKKAPKQSGGLFKGGARAQAQQSASPAPKAGRQSRKQSAVDNSVVLFNPKSFDEAGELVTYLSQGRSLVMALEGIPMDTARRLLDFISGVCFALSAKITPVSSKTYFITPENVDLVSAQSLGAAGEDQSF